MSESGRILIADDEKMFLDVTAKMLRREGYECACAHDGAAAAGMLRDGDYDLLIADIRMPGNPELELIQDLPPTAQGMPVIVVTGFPSLNSAIVSVHLPVVAYLVKPVDFHQLKARVKAAITETRLNRSLRSSAQRLHEWSEQVRSGHDAWTSPSKSAFTGETSAYLDLAFANIIYILSDVKHLTAALTGEDSANKACRMFDCPRLDALTRGLRHAVRVLDQTKHAFKSKQLGELRKGLEALIAAGQNETSN